MIRYEVEITGHEAPFKWQLKRHEAGKVTNLGNGGETESYDEALWEAQDAAKRREYDRVYSGTKRTEVLFEVDEDSDNTPDPPASIEAEAWQDFQGA